MMPKKIKTLILSLVALFVGASLFGASPVFADDNVCGNSDIPIEVQRAAGCPDTGTDANLPDVIVAILNSIIAVGGVVAVVYIIIGGYQYMTSTGDPSKIKKAKDTILYAVIGLIVCVLAFAIVNWVIVSVLKQGAEPTS